MIWNQERWGTWNGNEGIGNLKWSWMAITSVLA
jgi:hypothetical protein